MTLHSPQVPLRDALDRLLDGTDLVWTVYDGAIVIVREADTAPLMLTRVYALTGPLVDGADVASQLAIDTVMAHVTPNMWDDVGGPASLTMSGNTLIVNHTWRAHEAIRERLARLRVVPIAGRCALIRGRWFRCRRPYYSGRRWPIAGTSAANGTRAAAFNLDHLSRRHHDYHHRTR